MRPLAFFVLAGFALGIAGCAKTPSPALCLAACKRYVELTGTAKRQQLARLPQEYKEKFDAKIGTDGGPIVDACVERCQVDGSIAAAECLVATKTNEDLAACRAEFGQQ